MAVAVISKKGAFVSGAMTEGLLLVIAALNEHRVLDFSRREVSEWNNVFAGYISLSLAKQITSY